MIKFKGTPGPWDYGWRIQPNGCPTVGGKGLMVCVVAHSAKDPEQKETALANANLISAAPDLLAALEECLPCLGWEHDSDEEIEREHELGNGYAELILRARAAIAKALGEQP